MEYIITVLLVILVLLSVSDKLQKRYEIPARTQDSETGVEIMDNHNLSDSETVLIDRREYEELCFYREAWNNTEKFEDADTNARNYG